MPLLSRKKQFAVKQEASEGVAETLAAGDVLMAVEDLDGDFTPEVQERNPLRADLSPTALVVGINFGQITGRTESKPGSPATADPQCHRLLLALGLQQHTARTGNLDAAPTGTFVPGEYITGNVAGTGFFVRLDSFTFMYVELVAFANNEIVTGSISAATGQFHATIPNFTNVGKAYRPNSVNPASFTAAVMHDGKQKKLFGGRGDGSLEVGGTGQIAYWNFTLSGAMTPPVDVPLFSGVSITDLVPETFLGASIKAGTSELCVDSFTLALANTVARRACSNAVTGVKSYRISQRAPTIAIDPEQELEATIDFFTKLGAGTLFGFYGQVGSTAGKRTIVLASRVQYMELGSGDREGISTHQATLKLSRGKAPGGDDEYLVVYA